MMFVCTPGCVHSEVLKNYLIMIFFFFFFFYKDDIHLKMHVAPGQYSWTRFVSQIWSHNSCCYKCHCYDLKFNRIIGYEKGRVISYFIFYYIYPL